MPWYASTFEHFAVTPVRPAPPERVDACKRPRPKPAPVRERPTADSARAS